jgi:hypothetical protein
LAKKKILEKVPLLSPLEGEEGPGAKINCPKSITKKFTIDWQKKNFEKSPPFEPPGGGRGARGDKMKYVKSLKKNFCID